MEEAPWHPGALTTVSPFKKGEKGAGGHVSVLRAGGCGGRELTLPLFDALTLQTQAGLLMPCPFLTGEAQGLADSPSSPEGPLSDQTEAERSRSLDSWAVGTWTRMGHRGSCSCLGMGPWGSEEGVLDSRIPVALLYDRCREDISARQLWQGGGILGLVCLEARDSPVLGLMAAGKLGWRRRWVWEVAWPGSTLKRSLTQSGLGGQPRRDRGPSGALLPRPQE